MPPRSVILPLVGLKVSVLPAASVPVKLSAPPTLLLKLARALLVKVPPRLMVLAASTTLTAPVVLQFSALIVSVPPLRASSVPLLANVVTLELTLVPPTVNARPLRLALMVPWLVKLSVPGPKKRFTVVPIPPVPCTTAPAPSVRLPARSTCRLPWLPAALPRLMVALLKVWLQPTAAPSKWRTLPAPVTLATPGDPPASVCSTRPLSTRMRALAAVRLSAPRTVTLSRALPLLAKTRPLVPVC